MEKKEVREVQTQNHVDGIAYCNVCDFSIDSKDFCYNDCMRHEIEKLQKEYENLNECISNIEIKFNEVYKCECRNKTICHDVHGCTDCQNTGVIPDDEFSGFVFHSLQLLEVANGQ